MEEEERRFRRPQESRMSRFHRALQGDGAFQNQSQFVVLEERRNPHRNKKRTSWLP